MDKAKHKHVYWNASLCLPEEWPGTFDIFDHNYLTFNMFHSSKKTIDFISHAWIRSCFVAMRRLMNEVGERLESLM